MIKDVNKVVVKVNDREENRQWSKKIKMRCDTNVRNRHPYSTITSQ